MINYADYERSALLFPNRCVVANCNFVGDVAFDNNRAETAKANGIDAFEVLSKSECLSADVNSAYDPTFNSVFEKNKRGNT